MAVEKRRSNGWQAFGVLTLSRAVRAAGVQRDDRRRSRRSAPSRPRPDRRRSDAIRTISPTRAAGCRTIARTCSGRWAASTCRGPASWSPPICRYFSGKPWAATAQIALPQGDQRILLEPRGSRRLSSQSLLDVRVSRTIRVGCLGRIELLLDVLNVLNDTAEEGLATDKSQPEFRSAHGLHGSASRDGGVQAEPGPPVKRSSRPSLRGRQTDAPEPCVEARLPVQTREPRIEFQPHRPVRPIGNCFVGQSVKMRIVDPTPEQAVGGLARLRPCMQVWRGERAMIIAKPTGLLFATTLTHVSRALPLRSCRSPLRYRHQRRYVPPDDGVIHKRATRRRRPRAYNDHRLARCASPALQPHNATVNRSCSTQSF